MKKAFCSNSAMPAAFTKSLSYDEQIQFLINKYNEMAAVINNLKDWSDVENPVSYDPQTGYTDLQKQQATENIKAVSFIENQILDEDEQMNARENINAMEYEPKDDFVKEGGAIVYDEYYIEIPANTNIATIAWCEPGRYYCPDVTGIAGFSASMPFEMYVYKVNSNLVRRYFQYDNGRKYVQEVELNPLKFYGVIDFGGFNVSYLSQNLTEDQKAQARENIGAGTGSGSAENAVLYTEQSLTNSQKTQARKNIDIDIVTTETEETADFTNLTEEYGITNNTTLTTTGDTESGTTCVTGFIPFQKGDIIRIKDPNARSLNCIYALYDTDKTIGTNIIGRYVNDIINGTAFGNITIENDILTWNTSTINYYFWNNAAYLRLTLSSADVIVTKNEEIVYTVKNKIVVNKDALPNTKQLANNQIVVIGDSIIGMTRDNTSVTAYAADVSGANVINSGFGGCRMSVHPTNGYAAFSAWALADAIATGVWTTQEAQASAGQDYFPAQLETLESVNFNNVNMFVIHYGTNDFAANVPIDNSENDADTNTVCGALRYSLRKLLNAFPQMEIFISLPLYRKWNDTGAETYTNSLGKTLLDYNNAIENVAYSFNCPVINGYSALGINTLNSAAFLSDGTHPNNLGRKAFGYLMGANFCTNKAGQACNETTLKNAIANCVLTTEQTLTGTQQWRARQNIGANNSVLFNTAQSLTDVQKEQARNNIGAAGINTIPSSIAIPTNETWIDSTKSALSYYQLGKLIFLTGTLTPKLSGTPEEWVDTTITLPAPNQPYIFMGHSTFYDLRYMITTNGLLRIYKRGNNFNGENFYISALYIIS